MRESNRRSSQSGFSAKVGRCGGRRSVSLGSLCRQGIHFRAKCSMILDTRRCKDGTVQSISSTAERSNFVCTSFGGVERTSHRRRGTVGSRENLLRQDNLHTLVCFCDLIIGETLGITNIPFFKGTIERKEGNQSHGVFGLDSVSKGGTASVCGGKRSGTFVFDRPVDQDSGQPRSTVECQAFVDEGSTLLAQHFGTRSGLGVGHGDGRRRASIFGHDD
mmetsp:Transcript_10495/g.18523  ORF Transcript_10495/g.18523 Transcript_10495/m.18523 type:complete len:219 (+) Transcript_10495:556-1212(+)